VDFVELAHTVQVPYAETVAVQLGEDERIESKHVELLGPLNLNGRAEHPSATEGMPQKVNTDATYCGHEKNVAAVAVAAAGLGAVSDVVDAVELDVEFGAAELDVVELGVVELDAVELDAVELDAVELDAVELDAVELDAVELDAVELGAAGHEAPSLVTDHMVEAEVARLNVDAREVVGGIVDGENVDA
jgi:hypothetical protein